MKIFVSHSSDDKDIAIAFVELLKAALPLSAQDIRCTSVDGYTLPAGANSDEQLRQEILNVPAFLALLSPASIESIYVIFELGARWGTKHHLAPIMVAGLTTSELKPPVSAIHNLAGNREADLHKLIGELSQCLDMKRERTEVYTKALKTFVTVSRRGKREGWI